MSVPAPLVVTAVAREAGLIAFAALVYFGVRGFTEDRIGRAFDNADWLRRAERNLGIAWEHDLQDLVPSITWLLTATNWIYVYGHWPVIAACGIALYTWRRERYVLLRNAMFISGLIGFAFFAAFPVAPPRLADRGIVDTVTEYSESYRALQPPALTNKYAAFPACTRAGTSSSALSSSRRRRTSPPCGRLRSRCRSRWRTRSSRPRTTSRSTSSRGRDRPRGARGGELLGRTYNRPRG